MHVGPTLPTLQGRENGTPAARWWALLRLFLLAGVAGVLLLRRVVVVGRSMMPTLLPGDRLLVVRVPAWWPLRSGSLVAVRDPRHPRRLLVKRATPAGAGAVLVLGDNPAESTDSRQLGPVPRRAVLGVVWYRYAPSERTGRLPRVSG